MELVRVDTQRAYELIWEKITTLELAPGAAINEGQLAQELMIGLVPVREAIRLLKTEVKTLKARIKLHEGKLPPPAKPHLSQKKRSTKSTPA